MHEDSPPAPRESQIPDWSLHRLKVFWAVAHHLSFTRAAEELSIAQPAVSHHIRSLELDLGVELFERRHRRIALTDAGVILFETCGDVFARLRDSAEELAGIRGGTGGSIVIAADSTVGTYVIPHALSSFHRAYPNVDIALQVDNRGGVIRRLREWQCELAVMASPPSDLDCEIEPFLLDRLVVVGPPDHPLAHEPLISISRLAEERFLIREQGSGTREATLRLFEQAGRRLHPAMELGSGEAIQQAVSAGLGIAVVSRWTVDLEVEAGRLVVFRAEGFPLERRWSIVRLRERRATTATRHCHDFLAQWALTAEPRAWQGPMSPV